MAKQKRMSEAMMREAAKAFGRRGGKTRAARLSREERIEIARKAAQARWRKAKKMPPDTGAASR